MQVAGDGEGITAFQMDIKVEGITLDIMRAALTAAKTARLHILDEMLKASPPPRRELSPYCARVLRGTVPEDKIGLIIGQGGEYCFSCRFWLVLATKADTAWPTDTNHRRARPRRQNH